MDKRWLVAGLVVATVATSAVIAFVQHRPDSVPLTEDPEAADQVTVYQSGLVFAELDREFRSPGGETVLALTVPASTFVDSLQVTGESVSVKEVRASSAVDPIFQEGDELVVTTETRTYEGRLVEQRGEGLLLDTGETTTLVPGRAVESIELLNGTATENPANAVDVEVLVEAPSGNRSVEVSYLAKGPQWVPSYQLDVDTGRFTFFGTLEGVFSWKNVTLDLVSGSPNVVAQHQPDRFTRGPADDRAAAEEASSSTYDVDVSSAGTLGSLHRYRLDRPVDLSAGETLRLPVLDDTVRLVDHYHEARERLGWGSMQDDARDTAVLERYELENNLSEPLPPGVVRFFEDGTWIGEDRLPQTAMGAHANVTVAEAFEVDARTVLVEQTSDGEATTSTYRLEVTNRRSPDRANAAVDLRALLDAPDDRVTVLSVEPSPHEQTGTAAQWRTALEPGDTASFQLGYERARCC
jgi:hypothetical protein